MIETHNFYLFLFSLCLGGGVYEVFYPEDRQSMGQRWCAYRWALFSRGHHWYAEYEPSVRCVLHYTNLRALDMSVIYPSNPSLFAIVGPF